MNADLLVALWGGVDNSPAGIRRQEALGQRELVENPVLPKEVKGATREQLTALGFKFGEDVDELFVRCELPPGWTKRGTDRSLHSGLLDEQGRRRAEIFYKAASYDRRADMRMSRRFNVAPYGGSQAGVFRCTVMDGETEVFYAGEWEDPDYSRSSYLEGICEEWLNDNYPEWRNPLAYW